jgi:hypothetical protein
VRADGIRSKVVVAIVAGGLGSFGNLMAMGTAIAANNRLLMAGERFTCCVAYILNGKSR